jgi:Glycosyl transferase family 2
MRAKLALRGSGPGFERRWIEMAAPRVSVLVDTYNHERFIEEALASAVEQDFPAAEMEILVVDDGSTDRTPEMVRKFEPRVRLLRKANGGQASAFNAGIPEARGEIVAFLDGDDWWARNKLTRVMEAMAADAAVGIIGHGIWIVNRDGTRQSETLREGFRFQANTVEGARQLRVRGAFLGTSRMTVRREVLRRIGAAPEALRVEADEYIFTLAAALALAEILPEALTYYRLHEGNAFQLARNDATKARQKQQAVEALAKALGRELRARGIDEGAVRETVEIIQADADQMRLMMDGGWPWETVRTEQTIYRARHGDASSSHRAFKLLMLGLACVTPPKTYYRVRGMLGRSRLYRGARQRLLPVPKMSHVMQTGETSAKNAAARHEAADACE